METPVERRQWTVEVVTLVTRHYTVEARTPEEAEAIAEDYYNEGEPGTIVVNEIEGSEAVPVEDGGDGDLLEVDPRDELEGC